ncbi:conserved hypothetical protein [Flavobacterium psychrophilum]|uniref:DUF3164 family protein n=1 Tax=Flavobacterium psychrophilum TaxID=96345 RepID=UPI000B7C0ACA|nr:DUF3164 family protein [Flavobacterium psychrophilum]SNA83224.1 conserved hypothetical protein [Flavobacterium psychrophilum]
MKVNEIIVNDPIILNNNDMNTTKPITEMTSAEIEAFLKQQKQTEFEEQQKKDTEFEKQGDLLVNSIVDFHLEKKAELSAYKELQTENLLSHIKMAYTKNGKELKEQKTYTEFSIDKKRKVQVIESDKLVFSIEANVHIDSIKEILKEKFKGQDDLYDFVDSILTKNKEGDYSPQLLSKAKRKAKKLNDMQLVEEFEKLEDCQIVVGISRYMRAYEKDKQGKFQAISINFSSL